MKTLQLFAPFTEATLAPLAQFGAHLVLVFGSPEVLGSPGLHAHLSAAAPGAWLAGCSTAGEISGQGVHHRQAVLTALRFEGEVHLRVAQAQVPALEDCQAAGQALGRALRAPDLGGILLFGKGVNVNGSALIAGLIGEVGTAIPISGGLAGDDGAFRSTLTLTPTGIDPHGVVAVGLHGPDLHLRHGSMGGWKPFGPARKVTRSHQNRLFELDGEPALNIYKRYLGDHAKDLPASGLLFPFEMLDADLAATGLIRTILGIDEADGSLLLAGDLNPEGYLRLMHASPDELVDGAEAAARRVADRRDGREGGFALLVSCVGRQLVMGDAVDEEVEAVAEILGRDTTLAGFYSYGEIAPFHTATDCHLHNQTMTITWIGET